MPALQAFHEQYGDQVPVLGVDFLDQYPGSALGGRQERGVTYPSLADPGGDLPGARRVREGSRPAGDVLPRRGRHDRLRRGRRRRLRADEMADLVREHLGVSLCERRRRPAEPAGLAAAGRGGRALDHRARPDPVHAAGGRGDPGQRRAHALRRRARRPRPAAHRAQPHDALAPRPGVLPGGLGRPGRDRPPDRPSGGRGGDRAAARRGSRCSPSCPRCGCRPATSRSRRCWPGGASRAPYTRSPPTRCTRSTASRSPSCATPRTASPSPARAAGAAPAS